MLRKAPGPPCPKCGCTGTELVNAGSTIGSAWAKFHCDHCDCSFTIGHRINRSKARFGYASCPSCDSRKTHVYSSPASQNGSGVRYHKCDDCGQNFKTMKIEE